MAQQPAALFIDGDFLRTVYNPEQGNRISRQMVDANGVPGEQQKFLNSAAEWLNDIETVFSCSFRTKICVMTQQPETPEIETVGEKNPQLTAAPLAENYAAVLKRAGIQCVMTPPIKDAFTGSYRHNSVDSVISTKATLLGCRGGQINRFVFVGHCAYLDSVLSVLSGEGKEIFFASFGPHGLHEELKQYASPHPGCSGSSVPAVVQYEGNTSCRHPLATASLIAGAGSMMASENGAAKLTLGSLQELASRGVTVGGASAGLPKAPSGGRAPSAGRGGSQQGPGSNLGAPQPNIPGQPNPLEDIMAGFEVPAPASRVLAGTSSNPANVVPSAPSNNNSMVAAAPPPTATTATTSTTAQAAPPPQYMPLPPNPFEEEPSSKPDNNSSIAISSLNPIDSISNVAGPNGGGLGNSSISPVRHTDPSPPAAMQQPSNRSDSVSSRGGSQIQQQQQSSSASPQPPRTPMVDEPTPSVQTTMPSDAAMHWDRNTKRFYYSVVHPKTKEPAVVWEHPLGPMYQQQVEEQVARWFNDQKEKRKAEKQKEREELLRKQMANVAAQQQQPQQVPQPQTTAQPVQQPQPQPAAQPQPQQPPAAAAPASNAHLLDPNYYAQQAGSNGTIRAAAQQAPPQQAQVSAVSYHRPDPSRVQQVLQAPGPAQQQQPQVQQQQQPRPSAPTQQPVQPQPAQRPVAQPQQPQPVAHPVPTQPVATPQPAPVQPAATLAAPAPKRAPDHEQAGLPPGWECLMDPSSGKLYYIDHNTQRTTWTKPPV